MSAATPQLLVAGDPRHGVARFAAQLAATVQAACPWTVITDAPRGPAPLHVHFTDRLLGDDPASAARRMRDLALGRRLTVTLHDVPQPSDGAALDARRVAYRDVAACSHGIVVSSEHERSLLVENRVVDDPARVQVIPLPVIPVPAVGGDGDVTLRDEVAILGFVYPGKGHRAAIDAVAGLPGRRPAVRGLGAVSPGHERDLDELAGRARRGGVDFAATGWLDDDELARRARRAGVPLAAHAHVSASGSINSWVAIGRVPLVADSRYARELERLRPGTIRRYAALRLREAIAEVRADPALSRLPDGIDTRPHLTDVAERYRRWWAQR